MCPIKLPDFLGIGAARSGTTSLHAWLLEHPEIYVPYSKRPEPHYFLKSDEYGKGLDYYSTRYFSDAEQEKVFGEFSSSYLFQPIVAKRIKKDLPVVKLIIILRNPIERAYSNYWHSVKNGFETESFEYAVLNEEERRSKISNRYLLEIQPYAYVARGFYTQQIMVYFDFFEECQLFICLYDELVNNPKALAKKIYRFLGVAEDFVPKSINHRFNHSNLKDNEMSKFIRQHLCQVYLEEITKLSELLYTDLSHWR